MCKLHSARLKHRTTRISNPPEKGTELWEGSTCVFHPLAFGGVICLLVRDTGFVEQVEGGESPDRHLLDLRNSWVVRTLPQHLRGRYQNILSNLDSGVGMWLQALLLYP